MAIKAISINTFSKNKISFSNKSDKKEVHKNINKTEHAIARAYKMFPTAVVLAGLTTLSSCTESDFKYRDLREVKEEYFSDMSKVEKHLSELDEKTFVLNSEKDSVFKETKDYKYSHVRLKSNDHTRVFGEILRKTDGKQIKFINVYDENDKLTSSTLKDPKTMETFYVSYEKGFLSEIHDKNGKEIPSSRYSDSLILLALALSIYGMGRAASELSSKRMTNKDVDDIVSKYPCPDTKPEKDEQTLQDTKAP